MSWSSSELQISVREVARLAQTGPSGQWQDAVTAAVELARNLAEPRGCWARLTDAPGPLFAGTATPVSAIVEGARERWLFAVTIGAALETEVQALFGATELLDAVLLDAAGSVAAEAACDLLQAALCPRGASERFSPGYCHWSMQGQRQLFRRLEPEAIGVELLDSMLMRPLKSVTGVVVRAPADALRVEPEACAQCDARGCTRRRAKFVASG